MSWGLDLLLMVGLLWLAWRALVEHDLFAGVVSYIAFGLLLALVWVRLRAPDLALAEAAVGSGVTGALFLTSLSRMGDVGRGARGVGLVCSGMWLTLGAVLLSVVLGWAITELPRGVAGLGLGDEVRARAGEAGVAHEVTAVLLNYRAYDTLLELGVLLIVLVGVWAVAGRGQEGGGAGDEALPLQPMLVALVARLVPVMVVTAGYLLWVGAYEPGGAFQAGAVVAGAGILLVLGRRRRGQFLRGGWMRWGVVGGLVMFVVIGLGALVGGREFLEYGKGEAGLMILVIELAAAVGIGLTLTLLFAGVQRAGLDGDGMDKGGRR